MKFWNYSENGNELRLEGVISSESWFGDEVTPKAFREELEKHPGALTVYINSPGGDVFAASEIYTMLLERRGDITVKVDALAASAASIIAMAGGTVLMSPTAFLMIHDPLVDVYGNKDDLKEAIKTLDTVKEGILNAYELKSKQPRDKIAALMQGTGTYLSAGDALELGFADGIIGEEAPKGQPAPGAVTNQRRVCVYNAGTYAGALVQRIVNLTKPKDPEPVKDSAECESIRDWIREAAKRH